MKKFYKITFILFVVSLLIGCEIYNEDFTYKWNEKYNGWLVTGTKKDTLNVVVPEYNGGQQTSHVVGVAKNAFKDMDIRSIKLPDSIKIIEEGAFENTTYLTGTLSLPKSVEYIGEKAFYNTGIDKFELNGYPARIKDYAFNRFKDTDDNRIVVKDGGNKLINIKALLEINKTKTDVLWSRNCLGNYDPKPAYVKISVREGTYNNAIEDITLTPSNLAYEDSNIKYSINGEAFKDYNKGDKLKIDGNKTDGTPSIIKAYLDIYEEEKDAKTAKYTFEVAAITTNLKEGEYIKSDEIGNYTFSTTTANVKLTVNQVFPDEIEYLVTPVSDTNSTVSIAKSSGNHYARRNITVIGAKDNYNSTELKTHCNMVYKVPSSPWNALILQVKYRIEKHGLDADLNYIDVSDVEDFSSVFDAENNSYTKDFTGKIDKWDMRKAKDISDMFAFQKKMGSQWKDWKFEHLEIMESAFKGTDGFEASLNNWNVSKVKNMSHAFERSAYNKPLDNWNVSKATTMERMFQQSKFNQDISKWKFTELTNTKEMFSLSEFNEGLPSSYPKVTTMQHMFAGSKFNQDINNWKFPSLTNVVGMFSSIKPPDEDGATFPRVKPMFNQDISSWDVSNIDDFRSMFFENNKFYQDLSNWKRKATAKIDGMFESTNMATKTEWHPKVK